jgi:hypothetical protein
VHIHCRSVRVGICQPVPFAPQAVVAELQFIVPSDETLDTIVNPVQVVQLAQLGHEALTVIVPVAVAFVQPLLLVVVTV